MLIIAIIIILTLTITGTILYVANRYKQKRAEALGLPPEPEAPEIPEECCGQHEVCEKDSLLVAVSRDIEYYDDEELDKWRGTPSDQYDDEQCALFREVLYTMQSHEVAGWVRSLQLRGIELPDDIKDEVLLIVGERRH
ncbi:MAG: phospholipase [Bacteroidaceae bacterium]|nr:phospholipase [Bacteroidaceae bacterium]